jgi:hypothetical protein
MATASGRPSISSDILITVASVSSYFFTSDFFYTVDSNAKAT